MLDMKIPNSAKAGFRDGAIDASPLAIVRDLLFPLMPPAVNGCSLTCQSESGHRTRLFSPFWLE